MNDVAFLNGLCHQKKVENIVVDRVESPVIIEGIEEYDCLCPVSKLTGHRGNPLTMLKVALSDKNSRLLDAILQEVPSINSDPRISDDDKLATLVSRLDTGTLAEQDNLTRTLSMFTEELFGVPAPVDKPDEVKETIDFKPADAPAVSE